MKFVFCLLLGCLCISGAELRAQDILGQWYSLDPEGEKEAIIELYLEEDKLFGKVVRLLQEEDFAKTCAKCPGDRKNKPMLDLIILRNFEQKGDAWTSGRLLVPTTGREYRCNLSLDEQDRLVMRGYVGFSWFGRTVYWYRVEQ